MSQSNRARVGLIVLAIAIVAGVGVLIWSSRSDDSANGDDTARGGDESARPHEERDRVPSSPEPDRGRSEAAGEAKAPPPAGESLHDRLGGREAIHAMTGKLLEAVQTNEVMMANDKIRARAEKVNVRELHQRITDYVCREAGGPCRYTGRPMKDYLVQLELTAAEWDAAAGVIAAVLTEMNVPDQEAEKLAAIFGALRDSVADD